MYVVSCALYATVATDYTRKLQIIFVNIREETNRLFLAKLIEEKNNAIRIIEYRKSFF